jgi:hypothetical protein
VKYFVKYKISENISETPEGFLVCIGVPIARTGEMVYGPGETPISDSKKVTIYRDEKEVFNPKTMASFEGKAITIKHPEEFVNPENWKELAVGVMQNVRRGKGDQGDDLIADLLVTDKMAIELVKNGLREVSCGYEAEYEQTDEDEKLDRGRQKNIVGNHLALVHQGRAGSGYAINDHKGDKEMKFKDKIRKLLEDKFPKKTADEVMKAIDEDKEVSKDEGMSYDELVKVVNELPEKFAAAMKKKKEGEDDARGTNVVKEGEAASGDEEESEDDDNAIESRLKTLEAAVEKCLEQMSKMKAGDEEEEEAGDDEEKMGDEEEEESEDDDFENSTMVGDEASNDLSRAEILAPGIKKSKDIRVKALKKAYETTEGKKVIDSLNGGKAPTFDSKEKVDTLFIAASEVLKASRTQELVNTRRKTTDYVPSLENTGFVSAEKLNEINAKFYKKA